MPRFPVLFLLVGLTMTQPLAAQTAPRPEDVGSLDGLITAFYEVELHREVQRFGMIAHVFSTYGYSDRPGGPIRQRGINSIQCFWDGARWWILGWIYDSERDGNPIPPEYLPAPPR